MFNSRKLIVLFVFYLFPEILIIIDLTKAEDSCLQQLGDAYKKYQETKPNTNATEQATADELTKDKEEIKRVPINDGPVQIGVTFYIDDINSISDVDMLFLLRVKTLINYLCDQDFRLDFYYLQHWTVYKNDCESYKNSLAIRHVTFDDRITKGNQLAISKEYFTLFWLPDIIIANAKELKQQSEIIDTRLLMMYFNKNDTKKEFCQMQYLARFESTVSCPMNFEDAPIDTQTCYVILRSFAFDQDKVILSWANEIEKNSEIKLLEHELKIEKSVSNTTLFNEHYSTLLIKMVFDRKLANKMVGVYTPSILIVMITFCTFWLGLNSTSERVTIGITALLALVTQFNDVRQSLPPTSYITEIDKWMIMCMVFVSAQMIQCTLVDHVYHHQQHNQKLKARAMNVLKHFRRNSENKQKLRLIVPDIKQDYRHNSEKVNPYARVFQTKPKQREIKSNAFERKSLNESEPNCGCISWLIDILRSLTSVPTTPDKPEYLPMKIDAYSRIIFPLFFASICMFYWPLMLLKSF